MSRLRPIVVMALMAATLHAALAPQEQLQFADGLFSRGMFEAAIREYLVYLGLEPDSPQADAVYYRIGESYRGLGNRIAAEKAYERVRSNYPNSPYRARATFRSAELLAARNNPEAAIAVLKQMPALPASDELGAAAEYLLANCQEKAGRTQEAAQTYKQLIQGHERSPLASHAALALGNLLARDPATADEAEAWYALAAENPASDRVGAEALFQSAESFFRGKKYEESIRAYQALAQRYPNDERVAPSRLPLAWALHHAGRHADALRLCEAALDASAKPLPADQQGEWLYIQGNCLRQLLRSEEAVAAYDRLMQMQPPHALAEHAAYEKALVLFKAARYTEALEAARPLEKSPVHRHDVYWLLAESYAALKKEDEAIQYYQLLAEQFPDSDLAANALYRLGRLLQSRGEWPAASEIFLRIPERRPRDELAPQALFASAHSLSKAQRDAEAIRDWDRLIREYPNSSWTEEALYHKALSEGHLRRDQQALATWRDLLGRFPSGRYTAEAYFWSGVLLEEAGRLEEAEKALRQALAAQPKPELVPRVEFRLGLVLQRLGRADESAAVLQKLVTSPLRDRFPPELLEWLAEYHIERGEHGAAEAAARLLVERATEDAWRQIGGALLGRALRAQGRTADALAALEKAVAVSARTHAAAGAYLEMGELALEGGEHAKAVQCFNEAATRASADSLLGVRARAYAGLGRALKAQGDLDGAARHFLSVGILFDDPALVPECLHEAAAALKRLGRAQESEGVLKELQERYPESRWAKEPLP